MLRRFAPSVRRVHRATGLLMGVCIVTAAFLYIPSFAVLTGNRYLLAQLHVLSGVALPVPLLVGLRSSEVRADLRRLNRFTHGDRLWLLRRKGLKVGKFNAGQKLNGALSAGAVLVLLGTGVLMYFTHLVRLTLRTGATFVHDWSALALGLLILGHALKASRDPDATNGMKHGDVPVEWAREHHAAWAE